MTSITPQDILGIGPLIMEELRTLFQFSKALYWIDDTGNSTFPPVDLSKRQRERAMEAFSAGQPFWDMISSTVIIPVCTSAHISSMKVPKTIGAFVLCNVDRTVGPDEASRWLPLLSSWIENTLTVRKEQLLRISATAAVPPYLPRVIQRQTGTSLTLHIVSKRGRALHDKNEFISTFEKFLAMFNGNQGGIQLEIAGYGPSDLWIMIEGLKESALSASLTKLYSHAPLKKYGISAAFVHLFGTMLDEKIETVEAALTQQVASVEKTARILNLPLFSRIILNDLERRFHSQEIDHILRSAEAELRGIQYAAAFLSGKIPEKTTIQAHGVDFDHIHTDKSCTCALIIKRVTRNKCASFNLAEWARQLQHAVSKGSGIPLSAVTVGVAASFQDTLKSTTAIGAAFYAYVHATMLGQGQKVVFDAITWQVIGDELIALGALRHACQAFRQGIKLDQHNSEIWNSLGVCLAQLGRKREAERAFVAAAERNPKDFMTFYNLCGIQHALGNHREAETSCRMALKIRPEDPMALTRLGQVLIDAGQVEEAIQFLQRAVKTNHSPPALSYRLLGTALYTLDRWHEAKRAFEKALKQRPDDTLAMASLALGYAEKENDHSTARRLMHGIALKSKVSPQLKQISARISGILE